MKNTRKENKEMNKKEQAMLSIAREIVFSEAGERIPSIIEYSQKYNISVGLIQKALISLQEEGALEIERRGVLGSYIKKINNEILMEKSVFGSLVGVMPLPYSKRYEGLATGIKNNFENYKVNFYFAYMSGSEVRLNLLRKGIYDFAIVSRLAYEIEKEKCDDIDVIFGFGEKSYVSRHVLLKAEGVGKIRKIGVDKNSEDQKYMTKKCITSKNCEYIEINYNETLKLLKNNIVDAIIWNYDEIEEKQIKIDYEELPNKEVLNKANEAVLVIKKQNQMLRKLTEKIINVEYIGEIQKKVLENKMLPAY